MPTSTPFVRLEVPHVPREFAPKHDLRIHFTSKEVRQAYSRVVRIQQRAFAFAKEHLRKRKPNPKPEDAKKYPTVADAPRIMIDIYHGLRNQEIQAWNVLAKLCGLPKLPTLRRRGHRRLLIAFGPEPQLQMAPILPVGRIDSLRRETRDRENDSLYDTEVFSPEGPPPPMFAGGSYFHPVFRSFPPFPIGRKEAFYDRESSWRPKNSGPR